MDVYIDPNKNCWFDENNNSILSTGSVVSKLFFNDGGDDTGIIKYSINDKVVYAEESED